MPQNWRPTIDAKGRIELGADKSLQGRQLFPPNDPWNQDISKEEIDPNSDRLIASIGLKKPLHPDFGADHNGVPSGIPYMTVGGNEPKVKVDFQYPDESDPGPYPIPPGASDRRRRQVHRRSPYPHRRSRQLETLRTFSAYPPENGKGWKAGSGAIFDLTKVSYGQPPQRLDQLRRGWPADPSRIGPVRRSGRAKTDQSRVAFHDRQEPQGFRSASHTFRE